jgi:hypothetical protein
MGATVRQGPHHGAQKSTRTGTVLFRMSPSKLVSETSWTFGLLVAINPSDLEICTIFASGFNRLYRECRIHFFEKRSITFGKSSEV